MRSTWRSWAWAWALTGLLVLPARAQLQASQWFFGEQAGLDFRAGAPVARTDGVLTSDEGCSSRADSLGNLLFYTNGVTVWNREHRVMAGGANLPGNTSTTQYLVVAQPGSRSRYFLFFPDEAYQFNGFSYCVVDMSRENGLGEVVRRNERLRPLSSERVAAVPHANGRDVWVIGHERDSDVFFAYLLTANGVSALPVLSRGAFAYRSIQVIGQLKASPNGRRLASAVGTVNPQQTQGIPGIELLDFDPATGRASNPAVLPPARIGFYGVEFSPDGTKLYATDPNWGLFQYDLTAPDVAGSVVQIPVDPVPGEGLSPKQALQLGPDGRIYVAQRLAPFTAPAVQALGVVTAPNRSGVACAYQDRGTGLGGRRSRSGLPSYMVQDLWHFTVQGACERAAIAFAFPAVYGADSVRWHFGDAGASPGRNTSTSLAPTHVYPTAGRYLVTLTLYLPHGYPYVLRRYVDVVPLPRVYLGRDTLLCPGNALRLDASQSGARYRWQDGSMAPARTVSQAGTYWVDVTNAAGCTARDSLRVGAAPPPRVQLGTDTVVCTGQSLTLRPRAVEAGVRYRWQDGSTAPALVVDRPGTYWLEGTNLAGCRQRDSVRVLYLTPPVVYLGPDTALCRTPESPFVLDATLPGVRYRWQDGSTKPTFVPVQSGTYWVTVSTPVCSETDSIRVRLYDCREQVFVPNIITPNGDGRNDRLEIVGLGPDVWSLAVFSRWGQPVYATPHYRQEWNAPGLANGVYYYRLQQSGSRREVKGWVEVAR